MAWQTPKTDWHGSTNSEGVYTGDRFNASDFNRIKNNLTFLRDMTERMVYGCPVHSPMGDGQKDPWSAMHMLFAWTL